MRMTLLVSRKAFRMYGVVLLIAVGCKGADVSDMVPEQPMPPNTILLSQMMRELSATPGFTDALLAQLDKGAKKGPALMTPALLKRLRELILGKDWQGLDRFPGWTMRGINPTVRVVGRVVGKDQDGGGSSPQHSAASASVVTTEQMKPYVDLGSYSLEESETVNLDKPSSLPGFTTEGLVSELGAGVVRGDDANPKLAPMHAESQRLADVLNRLSLNGLDGATTATAVIDSNTATTPQELVQ